MTWWSGTDTREWRGTTMACAGQGRLDTLVVRKVRSTIASSPNGLKSASQSSTPAVVSPADEVPARAACRAHGPTVLCDPRVELVLDDAAAGQRLDDDARLGRGGADRDTATRRCPNACDPHPPGGRLRPDPDMTVTVAVIARRPGCR